MNMTNTFSLPTFVISILLAVLMPALMVKYWGLKKSSFFSCFTWFLFFQVTGEYFRLLDYNTRDLADVWFLFALGYMVIFEYSEWIDYDQITR